MPRAVPRRGPSPLSFLPPASHDDASLRLVERDRESVVQLDQSPVSGRDGAGIHDPTRADQVLAARLVDVAAEDEVRLLALDEEAKSRASDMLPGSKAVARRAERRRVR